LWIKSVKLTVQLHLVSRLMPAALLCCTLSLLGVQAQRQFCMYLFLVILKYYPFWCRVPVSILYEGHRTNLETLICGVICQLIL
jgi:hypothetical protein